MREYYGAIGRRCLNSDTVRDKNVLWSVSQSIWLDSHVVDYPRRGPSDLLTFERNLTMKKVSKVLDVIFDVLIFSAVPLLMITVILGMWFGVASALSYFFSVPWGVSQWVAGAYLAVMSVAGTLWTLVKKKF